MLETLKPTPPDKIIELIGLFRADPRTDKSTSASASTRTPGPHPGHALGQGGGAAAGEEQDTKAYVGLLGDLQFVAHGRARRSARRAGGAAVRARRRPAGPGRSGSSRADPAGEPGRRRSGMSDPTWPNHPAILGYLGIPSQSYRYFDEAPGGSISPG